MDFCAVPAAAEDAEYSSRGILHGTESHRKLLSCMRDAVMPASCAPPPHGALQVDFSSESRGDGGKLRRAAAAVQVRRRVRNLQLCSTAVALHAHMRARTPLCSACAPPAHCTSLLSTKLLPSPPSAHPLGMHSNSSCTMARVQPARFSQMWPRLSPGGCTPARTRPSPHTSPNILASMLVTNALPPHPCAMAHRPVHALQAVKQQLRAARGAATSASQMRSSLSQVGTLSTGAAGSLLQVRRGRGGRRHAWQRA